MLPKNWGMRVIKVTDWNARIEIGVLPMTPQWLLVYNDRESFVVSLNQDRFWFEQSGPGPMVPYNGWFQKVEPGDVCDFKFSLENVYHITAQEADAFLQAEICDALGCGNLKHARKVEKLLKALRHAELLGYIN